MRRYKALDMLPLAENETHVRDYHCSELNFPKCAGFLRVTTQRVIFYGFPVKEQSILRSIFQEIFGSYGHTKVDLDFSPSRLKYSAQSRLVNETYLKGITSVSSFYGIKILVLPFILAWIIGLATLAGVIIGANFLESMPFSPSVKVFTTLAVVIITFLLLLLAVGIGIASFRKVFNLKIFGASSNDTISIGESYQTLWGADKVFSIVARPSEHADEMMLELGALIADLQGMGDRAVAKWHERWQKREAIIAKWEEMRARREFADEERAMRKLEIMLEDIDRPQNTEEK